jgi:hypothetical protein
MRGSLFQITTFIGLTASWTKKGGTAVAVRKGMVPDASRQDLQRIMGYVAWLTWAMDWPRFLAMAILQRETFWIRFLHQAGILHHPRLQRSPLRSRLLYTDATPSSIAAVAPGPPAWSMVRYYEDRRPIAFAEMAAAIVGLHQFQRTLTALTTITLCMDSAVVYHTQNKGTGSTLRYSLLLKNLYVQRMINKLKSGHGLVVRWVPSAENLADPLSRGVLAP